MEFDDRAALHIEHLGYNNNNNNNNNFMCM